MSRRQQTPMKPMPLIDMWEALARNKQYAKDYRNWQKRSTGLKGLLEHLEVRAEIMMLKKLLKQTNKRTKDIRDKEKRLAQLIADGDLVPIEERRKGAGLREMPNPQKIPRIIRAARLQAEALVPEGDAKFRERTIREKMEQTLPAGIFQGLSNAVKQVPYKEDPSLYKGKLVDTYTYQLREGKFCMVEIDITGGPRGKILEHIGAIIDEKRKDINFQTFPPMSKLNRKIEHWGIYDQIETGDTYPHRMAKKILGSSDNAGYAPEVQKLSKEIGRAYKAAKKIVSSIYPSAS